jgi:hypothetical protein
MVPRVRNIDSNDSFHSTVADVAIKFNYTFRF